MIPVLSMLRNTLSLPGVYTFFQNAIGSQNARAFFIEHHLKPREGDDVLDIGCGPGDILASLPQVNYVGFDMHAPYIEKAKKRFGDRGTFLCRHVNRDSLAHLGKFDVVLAIGVLHHLDDTTAMELFELAKEHLKPSGRLITVDGCYINGQSPVARFLISQDRGAHVRHHEAYVQLIKQVFPAVTASVHHDLLKIPYTHLIMEAGL